jgi:hypothetical protein
MWYRFDSNITRDRSTSHEAFLRPGYCLAAPSLIPNSILRIPKGNLINTADGKRPVM